jgi:hypothetical protein
MSYDVSVGTDSFNYTYNLAPFFRDAIADYGRGGGMQELDGVTGARACMILRSAFEEIQRIYLNENGSVPGAARFCAKYDAANGWGSTVGAMIFLTQVLAACSQNRRRKVRVS